MACQQSRIPACRVIGSRRSGVSRQGQRTLSIDAQLYLVDAGQATLRGGLAPPLYRHNTPCPPVWCPLTARRRHPEFAMLLGIVSDTHGHVAHARAAVHMLNSLEVDVVVHCGDIGSTAVIELFHGRPTHFVLGNVDGFSDELQAAIAKVSGTFHGRFGALEIEGRRIALLHGDDQRLLAQSIADQKFDLVCYGHTHVAEQHRHGKTLVVNPGALYRAERHTIAIARIPELEVTHVTV